MHLTSSRFQGPVIAYEQTLKGLQQPNWIQSLLAGIEFVWNKITIHEYTVILPINIGQHNLKFAQVCYKSSSTTELLLIHSLAYVNLFTALMFFLHVSYNQTELFCIW